MWFDNLINVHSAVQGIVILSLICTLGLALGKIHVIVLDFANQSA